LVEHARAEVRPNLPDPRGPGSSDNINGNLRIRDEEPLATRRVPVVVRREPRLLRNHRVGGRTGDGDSLVAEQGSAVGGGKESRNF
jgi:hypothetical protein